MFLQKAGAAAALIAAAMSSHAQSATSNNGNGMHDFVLNGTHYHVFEASGTLNVTAAGNFTVFLVAGGGGGGGTAGAGGGAGGIVEPVAVSLPVGQVYVTVGQGGAGGDGYGLAHQLGHPGGNSSIGTATTAFKTAYGGGGGGDGGRNVPFSPSDGNGGSGGGSGYDNIAGLGTPGQGYNGGGGGNGDYGAGGGGAGGAGSDLNGGQQTPNGGPGRQFQMYASFATQYGTFSYGSPAGWFGGGGGGGMTVWKWISGQTAGIGGGGTGGGGNGSGRNEGPSADMTGVQFTGGGGGGAGYNGHDGLSPSGGSGGSGLVIISYPDGGASAPAAPAITSTGLPAGTAGTYYDCQLAVQNTTGFNASGFPDGLSIDQYGRIKGTTASTGTFTVTLVPLNGTVQGAQWTKQLTMNPAATSTGGPYLPLSGGTVTGNLSVGANPVNFTPAWSGTPDGTTNVSEISNDVSSTPYGQRLMIVGNKSAGANYRRVGIWDQLDINGAGFQQTLNVNGGGYFTSGVGIGTNQLVGHLTLPSGENNPNGGIIFNGTASSTDSRSWQVRTDASFYGDLAIGQSSTNTGTDFQQRLYIGKNGSIGIGTSSVGDASYRLFVETGIRTKKLKVDAGPWPDYVFDTSAYKLSPLGDVEGYIQRNKHLPGLPSAKEVKAGGIDVGENQAMLLQKIEELTLYTIAQDKKQQAQDRLIAEMKKELETMRDRDKRTK